MIGPSLVRANRLTGVAYEGSPITIGPTAPCDPLIPDRFSDNGHVFATAFAGVDRRSLRYRVAAFGPDEEEGDDRALEHQNSTFAASMGRLHRSIR